MSHDRSASEAHSTSKDLAGIAATVTACLFDLDGVLTKTARVHAEAWRRMFDEYLREVSRRAGTTFQPFDQSSDYVAFVDGRLRIDGVREFLTSRGLWVPEGTPDDPATCESLHGLGRRKNAYFREVLESEGVEVYVGSVRFVEAARARGLRAAVVSASSNCREVLIAAGLDHLFDVRIDGVLAADRELHGKPAPDMFIAAAEALGVAPRRTAVFEDATAGVAAARAGGFAVIVGVDRGGNMAALRASGADIVVTDLSQLLGPP